MSAKNLITVEVLEGILDNKLKPMLSTMDELKGTVQFLSDKFDLTIKKVQELEEKLLITDQENKHLKTEVSRLSTLVAHTVEELNNVQQYSRRDCVEISGIPEIRDENTNKLVIAVGTLIGVQVNESDISLSHRLPNTKASYVSAVKNNSQSSNNISKIIVKFTRRDVKEKFYHNRKYLKDKSTADLNLGRVSSNKIYISESLI